MDRNNLIIELESIKEFIESNLATDKIDKLISDLDEPLEPGVELVEIPLEKETIGALTDTIVKYGKFCYTQKNIVNIGIKVMCENIRRMFTNNT